MNSFGVASRDHIRLFERTGRVRRSLVILIGTVVALATPTAALAQGAASSPAGTGSDQLIATTYPSRFLPGTRGGTVKAASYLEATQFNPYYANFGSDAHVRAATSGGLVTITDDLRYAPDEAKSVPTIANGGVVVQTDGSSTVTWHVRSGLQWSDGRALTCEDYRFTAAWITDPANALAPKMGYLTQAGLAHYQLTGEIAPEDINLHVTCPTPTKMVWSLAEPFTDYLSLLPYPLPKHYLAAIPIADSVNGEGYLPAELPDVPVSGPFLFVSDVPGAELDLARDPRYQDHLTGGTAYLAHLDFLWYPDIASMIADYASATPPFDVALDLTEVDRASVAGLHKVVVGLSPIQERLGLNWSPTHCAGLQGARGGACPLSDPAMREAIAYDIDRDTINADVYGGLGTMTESITRPGEWYSAPPPARGYDPVKAMTILTDAGWFLDTSRNVLFRDFNGNQVKDGADYDAVIRACARNDYPSRVAVLNDIAASLRNLGILMRIRQVDSFQLFGSWQDATRRTVCNLSRGNFDVAAFAYVSPIDDPTAYLSIYGSSRIGPFGGNYGRVRSTTIDTALTTVSANVDVDTVYAAMGTFQDAFQAETADIPLSNRQSVSLVNPALRNISANATGAGLLWNAQHWWIAP